MEVKLVIDRTRCKNLKVDIDPKMKPAYLHNIMTHIKQLIKKITTGCHQKSILFIFSHAIYSHTCNKFYSRCWS